MKPEEVKRVIPEPKESNVPEKTIIKTKQEIKEEIVKGITASGRAMPPDRIIQSMVDREYARLTEEVQKQAASEESETPTPKKTANSNQNNPSTPGVTIDPQRLATLRAGLKQIKEQPKAAPKEVENKQPSWVKPGR
jgi:hypothetical protein